MTIEAFAPAKVNLTLHVTGQRTDGYHLLESLVTFADFGDHLSLTPARDLTVSVSGPFAQGVPADHRNLAWRAAELAGWTGHIHIEKNLPHGAGIGGGSSDAAAVLRALDAATDGLELGADVPACRIGRACVMSGIGETVQPLCTPLPVLHAVLVNPGIEVPTPAVFKALTHKSNGSMELGAGAWPDFPGLIEWLANHRNDLQAPAQEVYPTIGGVISELNRCTDIQIVRMSGSGATCFGVFADKVAAESARDQIKSLHPDWWSVATTLS